MLPIKISKATDKAVDKEYDEMDVDHLGDNVPQGISITSAVNELGSDTELSGAGRRASKRKGRKPTIKEDSSSDLSDSDAPLVRNHPPTFSRSKTDLLILL